MYGGLIPATATLIPNTYTHQRPRNTTVVRTLGSMLGPQLPEKPSISYRTHSNAERYRERSLSAGGGGGGRATSRRRSHKDDGKVRRDRSRSDGYRDHSGTKRQDQHSRHESVGRTGTRANDRRSHLGSSSITNNGPRTRPTKLRTKTIITSPTNTANVDFSDRHTVPLRLPTQDEYDNPHNISPFKMRSGAVRALRHHNHYTDSGHQHDYLHNNSGRGVGKMQSLSPTSYDDDDDSDSDPYEEDIPTDFITRKIISEAVEIPTASSRSTGWLAGPQTATTTTSNHINNRHHVDPTASSSIPLQYHYEQHHSAGNTTPHLPRRNRSQSNGNRNRSISASSYAQPTASSRQHTLATAEEIHSRSATRMANAGNHRRASSRRSVVAMDTTTTTMSNSRHRQRSMSSRSGFEAVNERTSPARSHPRHRSRTVLSSSPPTRPLTGTGSRYRGEMSSHDVDTSRHSSATKQRGDRSNRSTSPATITTTTDLASLLEDRSKALERQLADMRKLMAKMGPKEFVADEKGIHQRSLRDVMDDTTATMRRKNANRPVDSGAVHATRSPNLAPSLFDSSPSADNRRRGEYSSAANRERKRSVSAPKSRQAPPIQTYMHSPNKHLRDNSASSDTNRARSGGGEPNRIQFVSPSRLTEFVSSTHSASATCAPQQHFSKAGVKQQKIIPCYREYEAMKRKIVSASSTAVRKQKEKQQTSSDRHVDPIADHSSDDDHDDVDSIGEGINASTIAPRSHHTSVLTSRHSRNGGGGEDEEEEGGYDNKRNNRRNGQAYDDLGDDDNEDSDAVANHNSELSDEEYNGSNYSDDFVEVSAEREASSQRPQQSLKDIVMAQSVYGTSSVNTTGVRNKQKGINNHSSSPESLREVAAVTTQQQTKNPSSIQPSDQRKPQRAASPKATLSSTARKTAKSPAVSQQRKGARSRSKSAASTSRPSSGTRPMAQQSSTVKRWEESPSFRETSEGRRRGRAEGGAAGRGNNTSRVLPTPHGATTHHVGDDDGNATTSHSRQSHAFRQQQEQYWMHSRSLIVQLEKALRKKS